MDKDRKRVLIDLECIIGNKFYNAKIQNWGPGGVFEGEGREPPTSRRTTGLM